MRLHSDEQIIDTVIPAKARTPQIRRARLAVWRAGIRCHSGQSQSRCNIMKITIDINGSLLKEAERMTLIHNKKLLVEKAIEEFIRHEKLFRLAKLLGRKGQNASQRMKVKKNIHAKK